MKTGPAGFIIGGIVILAAGFSGPETIFPLYMKIIGGVGLIVYGIFRIVQTRDKGT